MFYKVRKQVREWYGVMICVKSPASLATYLASVVVTLKDRCTPFLVRLRASNRGSEGSNAPLPPSMKLASVINTVKLTRIRDAPLVQYLIAGQDGHARPQRWIGFSEFLSARSATAFPRLKGVHRLLAKSAAVPTGHVSASISVVGKCRFACARATSWFQSISTRLVQREILRCCRKAQPTFIALFFSHGKDFTRGF